MQQKTMPPSGVKLRETYLYMSVPRDTAWEYQDLKKTGLPEEIGLAGGHNQTIYQAQGRFILYALHFLVLKFWAICLLN